MWPFPNKHTEPDPVSDLAPQREPAPPDPIPEPVPQAPKPAPEPEHVQEESTAAPEPAPASEPAAGWSWLTPTRVAVAAATVPSALSLVWVASTVAEITGGPAGLAAGIFADVLIVSTVAVGWFNSDVRRLAGIGGWVASIAAGLLLGWHHWGTEEIAFALVPVGAKFLWHVALVARTAWERRRDQAARARADAERQDREEAESRQQAEDDAQAAEAQADDFSLTVEQRSKIATAKQSAAFKRQLADAQADEAKADIYAENTVLMAKDQAEADRMRKRYELAGQVAGQLPIEVLAQFMPGLGQETNARATEVPHRSLDRSRTEPAAPGLAPAANTPANPVAGFGAGLIEASTRPGLVPVPSNAGPDLHENGFAGSDQAEHAPGAPEEPEHGSAGPDQAEHPVEDTPTDAATRAAIERADRRRADALALWEQGRSAPEIAAQMGRDKRTVRGYLAEKGVTADQMDQRVRDRVQAYIEHKGPHAETRAMAADLHLTRTEAKSARERLAAEGVQVYAPKQ